jgi:serralysin
MHLLAKLFFLGLLFTVASLQGAEPGRPELTPVITDYRSFEGESLKRYAWTGTNVAFLTVDRGRSPMVMGKLVAAFDRVCDYYRQATGRTPSPARQYEGRTTVAEVQKTCGAGCGYLGATGIELMPEYFQELYQGVADHDEYDQALLYEFGRNFWFYSPQLAYRDPDDGGSVVTGYAVFMRFMAAESAGLKVGPFRERSGEEFRRRVEEMVDLYLADKSLTWENTLRVGRAPDNPMGLGSTDLFAGFCFRLYRDYGGRPMIARLWQESARRPPARSTQDAVDNFVLSASVAAGKDLTGLFADTWRWPVSRSARDEAPRLLANPKSNPSRQSNADSRKSPL